MVSDVLRLAVIGCGYVAQNDYFPVLATDEVRERAEVVAVCDTVPGRARDTAARFGFGAGYTDLESTLADGAPDLVAILTPIPLHFDQAMRSLDAGAHVYVQKTMTSTLAQARELTRRAAELSLVLTASPGQMLDECAPVRRAGHRRRLDRCRVLRARAGPAPGAREREPQRRRPGLVLPARRRPAAGHRRLPADQPRCPDRPGRGG